jgi:hypothetical protein
MARRIWCNPKYVPAELQERAVAAALDVLSARGVTLEQASEGYAHAEQVCDNPESTAEASPEVSEWETAWFDAIAAAKATLGLPTLPMGAILALDEADDRFGR